jgi:type VI secretion system protein ImpB
MARESTQHKLDRVRPPRVHITYDVELGGAIELKELPFVMGVLADLSGKPDEPLPRLRERKFVAVDRDNFDDVMAGMKPRLAFQVDNKLQNDNTRIGAELRFKSIEDFEPEQVAKQVKPLADLLDLRRQLTGLLAKADGNDRLNEKLMEIIGNTEKLQQVARETHQVSDPGDKNGGNPEEKQ